MNLQKCQKGHFFDGDKFTSCPHCTSSGAIEQTGNHTSKERSQKREAKMNTTKSFFHFDSNGENTNSMTGNNNDIARDKNDYSISEDEIRNKLEQRNALGPVYGWLVGIGGNEYGRSYELFATENTIGSGNDNIIVLESEKYICQKDHAIINYDFYNGQFYYDFSKSQGKFIVNAFPISSNMELNYGDTFEIGTSTFMFVPLCKDGFNWNANTPSAYNQNNVDGNHKYTEYTDRNQYSTAQNYSDLYDNNIGHTDILSANNAYNNQQFLEEDANLTGSLILSPWRCESCNALNSVQTIICRICGDLKQ